MICHCLVVQVYAFPKTQQLLLRGIIAFFCTLILVIHVKVQPFLEPLNNRLETALLLILCLISTLTTIDSQQSSRSISNTITVLSALPLLPLPFLAVKYCRRTVVPRINEVVWSKSRSDDEYVPPPTQGDVDEDIGNTKRLVDDDKLL